MAQATVQKETFVTLVMSEAEAKVLLAICWRISGDPKTTVRGDMDRIEQALRSVGIVRDQKISDDLTGSIDCN